MTTEEFRNALRRSCIDVRPDVKGVDDQKPLDGLEAVVTKTSQLWPNGAVRYLFYCRTRVHETYKTLARLWIIASFEDNSKERPSNSRRLGISLRNGSNIVTSSSNLFKIKEQPFASHLIQMMARGLTSGM